MDLHTEFRTGAGIVRAVDGISYTVNQGETVAIVGESGSGKSVGALSILRLIPVARSPWIDAGMSRIGAASSLSRHVVHSRSDGGLRAACRPPAL
jgi:ABC-type dipeptide/oligopeptide/nickel transport system ATPase component